LLRQWSWSHLDRVDVEGKPRSTLRHGYDISTRPSTIGPELLDAVVITTGSEAHRRADGIAFVPAALLTA
jgi:hypothetical protein